MAREWLRECSENHDGCRVRFNSKSLPSRLIDVGHPDQSGDFSVSHLIDTHGSLPSDVKTGMDWQYVTLSRCWGKSTHLSTKKDTLNERKHAIPLNSLNKTYADAVRVTREVQMRYLWIDSLCIIQDFDEDWIEESSKMCFVYNNAKFNIAAAAALDGNSGFLLERLSVKLGHVIRTEKRQRRGLCGFNHVLKPDMQREKRVFLYHVHFLVGPGSDEDPAKDAGNLDIFVSSKLATFPYLALDKGQQRFYSPREIDIWYQLLEIYSGKQILHRKDKLPAVSGLAYQLGSIIGDSYLAGLWARDFPQALLCWLPYRASCGCVRRSTMTADSIYDAPSWSWVSCCTLFNYAPAAFKGTELLTQDIPLGNYSFPGSENTDILWDAMLVGAHIDFVSNRYGPVRSGSVTIKGHLLKIDISCSVSPFRENVAIYNELVLGTFYADAKLDVKKVLGSSIRI
ncbi:HET domain-containing protein [Botrytis cinerea]